MQRPLPDNTQHSQQTDIHSLGGIRNPQFQQSERPQTHTLDRAATGTGHIVVNRTLLLSLLSVTLNVTESCFLPRGLGSVCGVKRIPAG